MSVVMLVSGGLDSTLMTALAKESGIYQYPLFVDYGQRAKERELAACRQTMARLGLPAPEVASLGGFGSLIRSGLTDEALKVVEDAFTPGRNMLFLLVGAAYAVQVGADAVCIGLLHQDTSLFPDQTNDFIRSAQATIEIAMGRPIAVLTPLSDFHKHDVVELAKLKKLEDTYSCHVGSAVPCGRCIACREFISEEIENGR